MSSPGDSSVVPDETLPSQAIIEAIADRDGVDVTDVEPPEYDPLYRAIDPEALDDLFASPRSSLDRTGRVSLEYCGSKLVVYSDGTVTIDDPPDERTADRADD